MRIKNQLTADMVALYFQRDHEEHLKNIIRNLNKYVDQFLKDQIKEHAIPQIKGEITKGKLKWRGISFGVCNETNEYWVLQRGIQIGKKLKLDFLNLK